MDSLHTGSEELFLLETEKLRLTIEGWKYPPGLLAEENEKECSGLGVFCVDPFEISIRKRKAEDSCGTCQGGFSGDYEMEPLFYEEQTYTCILHSKGTHRAAFAEESMNLKLEIHTRQEGETAGVFHFGAEVGYSELVIQVDGAEYLRLTLEVFPTRLKSWQDYKDLTGEIAREVSSLAFDLPGNTYLKHQQKADVHGSPVEFFAVVQASFQAFLQAVDRILMQPNHALAPVHTVGQGSGNGRVDRRSLRWLEQHPMYLQQRPQGLAVEQALIVTRQITYDTEENRLLKGMLLATAKRLRDFQRFYSGLHGREQPMAVSQLTVMLREVKNRLQSPLLASVNAQETVSTPSAAILRLPAYREAYQQYQKLLRGMGLNGGIFCLSSKKLPELYEVWCFLKLNSLMKDRYQLLTQNILRTQSNGVTVFLAKGAGSQVRYRDSVNGEKVTLSYEAAPGLPTGPESEQVLRLTKQGISENCDYLFSPSYHFEPEPSEDDDDETSDDVEAVKQYREELICQGGADTLRNRFGACILFPERNEETCRMHHICQCALEKGVGALPFLPSACKLVTDLLDDLLADTPGSIFEKAALSEETEQELRQAGWTVRDVLVGSLRNREQLDVCLRHRFYHVPADRIPEEKLPIRYVAIYQSKTLFGPESGVRYYGEVIRCRPVLRRNIREIPKNSDELYYRFEVREWRTLPVTIAAKEIPAVHIFTTLFLLEHGAEMPDLMLEREEDYRFYTALKQAYRELQTGEKEESGFAFQDAMLVFEGGKINAYQNRRIVSSYKISDFARLPGAVTRWLYKDISDRRRDIKFTD